MGKQANGGSGGIQENKRWSLIHSPRLLAVLLVISMIHVAASTLDQGIRFTRNAKTTAKNNTQSSSLVCNTKGCQNAVDVIQQSLNLTVDPCEDFYEFVCGRGPVKSPVPGCDSRYIRYKLHTGKMIINGTSAKVKRMPSDFYKSCINLTAIENLGAAPLRERITELGGWDMSGNWDEDTWDFGKIHLLMERTVGAAPVFWSQIVSDSKDDTKNAIQIHQYGPALNKIHYLNLSSKTILAYRQFIIDVVVLLGADPNITANKADEIIRFEAQLANVSLSERESQEAELFEITLEQLEREIPEFNWTDHFHKLLAPYKMPSNERISMPLSYLKNAMNITNTTPKR